MVCAIVTETQVPGDKNRSIYVFAIVLSLLEFHVYADHHAGDESALARLMLDITNGQAYWRAYQSRLIGPWTIRLLSGLMKDDGRAFLVFAAMGIVTANIVAAWLSAYYLRNRFHAAIALNLFVLGYVLLFDYWTYPWDFIEVATFLPFAYLAVEGKSPLYILPLFGICLVNRESCLFIGAWYGIRAITAKLIDRDSRFDVGQMTLSAALLAIGGAYTMISRELLFIGSPAEGSDVAHKGFGNHLMLLKNLETGNISILTGFMILSICLVFTIRFGNVSLARRSVPDIALALLIIFILLQMMVFAFLAETRTFYTVLPLIFVAGLRWWRDAQVEEVRK
jgi:hypothetical protein